MKIEIERKKERGGVGLTSCREGEREEREEERVRENGRENEREGCIHNYMQRKIDR